MYAEQNQSKNKRWKILVDESETTRLCTVQRWTVECGERGAWKMWDSGRHTNRQNDEGEFAFFVFGNEQKWEEMDAILQRGRAEQCVPGHYCLKLHRTQSLLAPYHNSIHTQDSYLSLSGPASTEFISRKPFPPPPPAAVMTAPQY